MKVARCQTVRAQAVAEDQMGEQQAAQLKEAALAKIRSRADWPRYAASKKRSCPR